VNIWFSFRANAAAHKANEKPAYAGRYEMPLSDA
jgi:hypothetical protein